MNPNNEPWTSFTNYSSIRIQIRKRPLQNFLHGTTAAMACTECISFCDMITRYWITAKRIFHRFWNCEWKLVSEMGPWVKCCNKMSARRKWVIQIDSIISPSGYLWIFGRQTLSHIFKDISQLGLLVTSWSHPQHQKYQRLPVAKPDKYRPCKLFLNQSVC